eukprot:15365956-Ditylum_brightwellii.AAC.2
MERLKLKQDEIMVMSLDIVNMYHLVRAKLIRKALHYCAKCLPDKAKETIELCMCIVQFGMKSTLIQFRGKYYVYHGAAKNRDALEEGIALAIKAYESVFLADIVASYVFGMMEKCI